MKESFAIFTLTLAVIGAVTWGTPAWLKAVLDGLLCVALILLFPPNMFF